MLHILRIPTLKWSLYIILLYNGYIALTKLIITLDNVKIGNLEKKNGDHKKST